MSLNDSVSPTHAREASSSNDAGGAREALKAHASEPSLAEEAALALLTRSDLPAEILEQIGKQPISAKSRKVKLALATHPATPRHVSLPLVRHLYAFDLMRVALTPVAPADVKVAADEALISRLEKLTLGEKLSLAKRASGRIAGALLSDADSRVIAGALVNSRLGEAHVLKAVTTKDVGRDLVERICRHPKWSLRQEVRVALLRSEITPFEKAREFTRSLPAAEVRQIIEGSSLAEGRKKDLLSELGKEREG